MAKKESKLKIFSLNRISFNELYQDCMRYVKQTYNATKQVFTPASPFGQLLQVVLHLGRMILYYIEDSITGLNIRTAYRPDQIKGLAQLAGHDAARPISSRGAITITYLENASQSGSVCYIPNKIKIKSKLNGCTYTVLFGADTAKMTMQAGNRLNATIIQGIVKIQTATGTGDILQSYNFQEKNYQGIDQYFINVYVNSELWPVVASLVDLGYAQKGCIVRTGITGGIDIFFGNNTMGACPPEGSTIMVEYVVTDGIVANLSKEYADSSDYWEFLDSGYLADGTAVNLNSCFAIHNTTDVIFGTQGEDTALTQLIAPHTSRAYVLANEINYKYFFQRMNMFSTVQIIRGTTSSKQQTVLNLAYTQALDEYESSKKYYDTVKEEYESTDSKVEQAKNAMLDKYAALSYVESQMTNHRYLDNTVYIFLIPDPKKRISAIQNYYNCDESIFTLSNDEKANILYLIDSSGQRSLTVENRIIDPQIVRFAVNVQAKALTGYNEYDIYSEGLEQLSKYFLNNTRHDIIPVSDIVSIFENNVKGIDSVKVWFDADVNNKKVYSNEIYDDTTYGIDEYGDIILTRAIINSQGEVEQVADILPLFRGGFISKPWADGVQREYSSHQMYKGNMLCGFNLEIQGYVTDARLTLDGYTNG